MATELPQARLRVIDIERLIRQNLEPEPEPDTSVSEVKTEEELDDIDVVDNCIKANADDESDSPESIKSEMDFDDPTVMLSKESVKVEHEVIDVEDDRFEEADKRNGEDSDDQLLDVINEEMLPTTGMALWDHPVRLKKRGRPRIRPINNEPKKGKGRSLGRTFRSEPKKKTGRPRGRPFKNGSNKSKGQPIKDNQAKKGMRGRPFKNAENIVKRLTSELNEKLSTAMPSVSHPSRKVLPKAKKACRQYCIFCQKAVKSFAVHIELHHNQEEVLQPILRLAKDSKERKTLIANIRRIGERHNKMTASVNCKTCFHCLAVVSESYYEQHRKRCSYMMMTKVDIIVLFNKLKELAKESIMDEPSFIGVEELYVKEEERIIEEERIVEEEIRSDSDEVDDSYVDSDFSINGMEDSEASDCEEVKNIVPVLNLIKLPIKPVVIRRRHCCTFCKKLVLALARHLTRVHSKEVEIIEILKMRKGSRARKIKLSLLMKRGDHYYNTRIATSPDKWIILKRFKRERSDVNQTICTNCLGTYSSVAFGKHYRYCNLNRRVGSRGARAAGRYLQMAENANERTRIIFRLAIPDAAIRSIQMDPLVIEECNNLTKRYSPSNYYNRYIRSSMKRLGNFMMAIKEFDDSIEKFQDVYNLDKVDHAVNAALTVAKYNTDKFSSSLLAELAATIRRCTKYLETDSEDFLQLFGDGLRTAAKNIDSRPTAPKEILIPTIEDVKKLMSYIQHNIRTLYAEIEKKVDAAIFERLLSFVSVYIVVLNGRREHHQIHLKDLENIKEINDPILGEHYNLISVAGKVDYFIISASVLDCLKYLMSIREVVGVESKDSYVFAIPGLHKWLDNHRVIYNISSQCGAEDPISLRIAKLRNQIATTAIIMELDGIVVGDYQKMRDLLCSLQINQIEEIVSGNEDGGGDDVRVIVTRLSSKDSATRSVQAASTKDDIIEATTNPNQDEVSGAAAIDKPTIGNTEEEDISDKEEAPNKPSDKLYVAETDSEETDDDEVEATQRKRSQKKSTLSSRRTWTDSEKAKIAELFSKYFTNLQFPSLDVCRMAINNNDVLKHRTAPQIKAYISNVKRKKQIGGSDSDSGSSIVNLDDDDTTVEKISKNRKRNKPIAKLKNATYKLVADKTNPLKLSLVSQTKQKSAALSKNSENIAENQNETESGRYSLRHSDGSKRSYKSDSEEELAIDPVGYILRKTTEPTNQLRRSHRVSNLQVEEDFNPRLNGRRKRRRISSTTSRPDRMEKDEAPLKKSKLDSPKKKKETQQSENQEENLKLKEFQKIIEHRCVVRLEPLSSHLIRKHLPQTSTTKEITQQCRNCKKSMSNQLIQTHQKECWESLKHLSETELDDLVKFQKYLNKITTEAYATLVKHFQYQAWVSLSKSSMLLLLISNRNKIDEIGFLTTEQYQLREALDEVGLSRLERILTKHFSMTESGIMIPKKCLKYIVLLLRYRKEANVSRTNKYLFATINDHYVALLVLQEFCYKCGIKDPSALRTSIVDTIRMQLLLLSDNEVEYLAKFLKHKLTVSEYYRISLCKKLAGFLGQVVDGETMSSFKGKSIRELADMEDEIVQSDSSDGEDGVVSSEVESDDDVEEVHEEDFAREKVVPTTSRSTFTYDKRSKHFCIYCKQFHSYIYNHLLTSHKNRSEIIRISTMPAYSMPRTQALESLRNKGVEEYILKFTDQPTTSTKLYKNSSCYNDDDYLACCWCNIKFLASHLENHQFECREVQLKQAIEQNDLILRRLRDNNRRKIKTDIVDLTLDEETKVEAIVIEEEGSVFVSSNVEKESGSVLQNLLNDNNVVCSDHGVEVAAYSSDDYNAMGKDDDDDGDSDWFEEGLIDKKSDDDEVDCNVSEESSSGDDESKQKKFCTFCIFCKKCKYNFARHIFKLHPQNKEVIALAAMPRHSWQRTDYIRRLRLRGMEEYNKDIEDDDKKLVVRELKTNITDYTTCLDCLGMFPITYLEKHQKSCKNKKYDFTREQNKATKNDELEENCARDATFMDLLSDKKQIIPSIQDLRKLIKHILTSIESTHNQLKQQFNINNWYKLSAYLLIYIIIFNKQSVEICSRLTLKEIDKNQKIKSTNEIASNYIKIPLDSNSILMHRSCFDSLIFLTTLRDKIGIESNNNFAFAMGGTKSVNINKIMKKISLRCEADKPELLQASGFFLQPKTQALVMQIHCDVNADEELSQEILDASLVLMRSLIDAEDERVEDDLMEVDNHSIGGEANMVDSDGEPYEPFVSSGSEYQPTSNNEESDNDDDFDKDDSKKELDPTPTRVRRRHQHFCGFCRKLVKCFGRHLVKMHKDKEEIIAVRAMPKFSKERKFALTVLRKKFDHEFSIDPTINTAIEMRMRQPIVADPIGDRVCRYCFGKYVWRSGIRHRRRCQLRTIALNTKSISEKASKELTELLFKQMPITDEIHDIRNDDIIMEYGNRLIKEESEKNVMIKLNLLGDFMVNFKDYNSDVKGLIDAFTKIKEATYAIYTLKGKSKNDFDVMIGSIKQCALIAAEVSNTDIEEFLIQFVNVLMDWNRVTPQIPTIEDMRSISKYFWTTIKKTYKFLQKRFSFNAWLKLSSSTLAYIIIFNRIHHKEVCKLTLDEVDRKESINKDNSILRDYIKLPCNNSWIIIHKNLFNCLKCIISLRVKAEVHNKNTYVFALPDYGPAFGTINITRVFNKATMHCQLTKPNRIKKPLNYMMQKEGTALMLQLHKNVDESSKEIEEAAKILDYVKLKPVVAKLKKVDVEDSKQTLEEDKKELIEASEECKIEEKEKIVVSSVYIIESRNKNKEEVEKIEETINKIEEIVDKSEGEKIVDSFNTKQSEKEIEELISSIIQTIDDKINIEEASSNNQSIEETVSLINFEETSFSIDKNEDASLTPNKETTLSSITKTDESFSVNINEENETNNKQNEESDMNTLKEFEAADIEEQISTATIEPDSEENGAGEEHVGIESVDLKEINDSIENEMDVGAQDYSDCATGDLDDSCDEVIDKTEPTVNKNEETESVEISEETNKEFEAIKNNENLFEDGAEEQVRIEAVNVKEVRVSIDNETDVGAPDHSVCGVGDLDDLCDEVIDKTEPTETESEETNKEFEAAIKNKEDVFEDGADEEQVRIEKVDVKEVHGSIDDEMDVGAPDHSVCGAGDLDDSCGEDMNTEPTKTEETDEPVDELRDDESTDLFADSVSDYESSGSSICQSDSEEVKVELAPGVTPLRMRAKSTNKLKYFKKGNHYCKFCNTLVKRLSPHLFTFHADEDKVKEIIALPVNSKERRFALKNISLEADTIYNNNAELNQGSLIRIHHAGMSRGPRRHNPKFVCPYCNIQFPENKLHKHKRTCDLRMVKLSENISERAEPRLRDVIFARMPLNAIANQVRNDDLIIEFGNYLADKNGEQQFRNKAIRRRMLRLGKLKIKVKEMNAEIVNLADIYKPQHADTVIEAIKLLGITGPAIIKEVQRMLMQCAHVLNNKLFPNDEIKLNESEEFIKLLIEKQGPLIVPNGSNKIHKSGTPIVQDVRKLTRYILTTATKLYDQLQSKFSYEKWHRLSNHILGYIFILNRNSSLDCRLLKLEEFNRNEPIISETLAGNYIKIPLLEECIVIHKNIFNSIKYLVETRAEAEVHPDNYLVFANNCLGPDFEDVNTKNNLHNYANYCGAKQPHTLRTTKLGLFKAITAVVVEIDAGIVNEGGFSENVLEGVRELQKIKFDDTEDVKASDGQPILVDENELDETLNENKSEITPTEDITKNFSNNIEEENKDTPMDSNDSTGNKICRKHWTVDQKFKLHEVFGDFIKSNKLLPSIEQCNEVIASYDELNEKTPTQIRSYIYNAKKSTPYIEFPVETVLDECDDDSKNEQLIKHTKRRPWTIADMRIVMTVFEKHIKYGKLPPLRECKAAIASYEELKERTPAQIRTYIWTLNKNSLKTGIPSTSQETPTQQLSIPTILPNEPKIKRKLWSDAEKNRIHHLFSNYISNGEFPSLKECNIAISMYQELRERTAPQIKSYLSNLKKQKLLNVNQRSFQVVEHFPWQKAEKEAVKKYFGKCLETLKTPSLQECVKVAKLYPVLSQRKPEVIKSYVYNEITKMKKKINRNR